MKQQSRYRWVIGGLCGLGLLVALGCLKVKPSSPSSNGEPAVSQATMDAIQSMQAPRLERPKDAIRFATFNVSFHRTAEGELSKELATKGSQQPVQIAEIIQRVRPDVILLNEFDYEAAGQALQHFQENYLKVGQGGQQPIDYPYTFFAPVNTGVDSGMDLDGDGQKNGPGDAFGYGAYPGQYGMVVLSKFPIKQNSIRTFQNFLWKDMPDARWPTNPATGKSYYPEETKAVVRLSSKSHWDVPIQLGDETVHFLVSHPTPPVFDGPEDRNGCRNHDEIRFWVDYISGLDYFYDDAKNKGGLGKGNSFVIAGDLNADPADGDSTNRPIDGLLNHALIDASVAPFSRGAIFNAAVQGEANLNHKGKPEFDTSSFVSATGNLRVDYCLPGGGALRLVQAGVYWPMPEEEGGKLVFASDHRLTWVDVQLKKKQN